MGSNCLKAAATSKRQFTFSSQTFLALILSTSERLKAESTSEPLNGFEHGTPGLKIQRFNHFSHIILIPPMEVYPPTNLRKKLCSHKVLANFQIKSPHYNEGTWGRGNETMIEFLKVVHT